MNLPSVLEVAEYLLSAHVFHKQKFARILRFKQEMCLQPLFHYFWKEFANSGHSASLTPDIHY